MGFVPSFRFGNPFFLQPNVDELIWRVQFKDNFSLVRGRHTFKVGAEWMHTLNDQVFRGFFTGRYLFDSVTGFLRYASPPAAGGFGPGTVGCSGGVYVTAPTPCPAGTTPTGGPLLFYLQGAGRDGSGHRRGRRLEHHQRGVLALRPGPVAAPAEHHPPLRPALGRADHARDGRSEPDRLRRVPRQPAVPVGRHDSEPVEHVAAALRRDLGREGRRQVGGALQRRHLLGAAEHAQPGRIGHDQRPAAADDLRQHRSDPAVRRPGAGVARCPRAVAAARRRLPRLLGRARLRPRLLESAHLFVERRATSRSSCPAGPATSTSSGRRAPT